MRLKRLIVLMVGILAGCSTHPPVFSPIPSRPPTPIKPKALVQPLAAMVTSPTPTTNVTFAWSPPAMQVAGFRLYNGPASRSYTNMVDAGSATNATVPLPAGFTSYVAATSYETNGLESNFSTEITVTPPPAPIVVYLRAFIQTNSTLNTNTWFNLTNFPLVCITNPPPIGFYRVDLLIGNQ